MHSRTIDPTHAENTRRRTSSYLRVTSLLETVAFKRTDWVTVWVTENIFIMWVKSVLCDGCVCLFKEISDVQRRLSFFTFFFAFIFRVSRAKKLCNYTDRVCVFLGSHFRPQCRLQERRLKRAFHDSFRKTFTPPLFAIRENNDDGATTTTVFFSFLPATTTKTVRHRTRGSDSRLPVRLLRTGTHTFELWTLALTLSLSPFYRARAKAWCAVVVLVLDVCVYLCARRSAR